MIWGDPWRFGAALWRDAMALGEVAQASGTVIGHRTRAIDAALRDPLAADLGELRRMVPEKVTAFSQAGASLAADMAALQADWMAQWADLARLAITPGPASLATADRIGKRAAGMAERSGLAAGRALAPIHKTATGNARRLGARKPRATGKA